ncbi:hypothetical protein NADFUDRAFT_5524, partial [Nadsonia fulvescens var. elongata DSM 6958]
EKTKQLQAVLFSAASNGSTEIVRQLLSQKVTQQFIDVNANDENGNSAIIYSSCFGHRKVTDELIKHGANVNDTDAKGWTPLIWAITNDKADLMEDLLDNGASLETASPPEKSPRDFVTADSKVERVLKERGLIENTNDVNKMENNYNGVEEDDVDHQMMMESAYNFNVNLGALDDNNSGSESEFDSDFENELSLHKEFLWDRCLPDQFFAFKEGDIPKILDIAITDFIPQRSRTQRPIPANLLYLCARYVHYYGVNSDTIDNLFVPAFSRIRRIVNEKRADVVYLIFWLSNCNLLSYYLKKDPNICESTVMYQDGLVDMMKEIYVLICQDCERRLEKILDAAILDHEPIYELDNVVYQNEWKLFRRKTHEHSMATYLRPPSPHRRALPSPRSVTSILNSVLFICDLYDIHPIISLQIIGQLLWWLGAVLFNRVMLNKKYLTRSKAMQIRLNISAIQDWARANNRKAPSVDEFSKVTDNGEGINDICKRHFSILVQLLQWLQCFAGFNDDFSNVNVTLEQLDQLNPLQVYHVANKYRPDTDESVISKSYKNYLHDMAQAYKTETRSASDDPLLDCSQVLTLQLPTMKQMIVSWGAGLGGVNKYHARRYEPILPVDFLDKLDDLVGNNNINGN